jgi:YD repeat-containing protein
MELRFTASADDVQLPGAAAELQLPESGSLHAGPRRRRFSARAKIIEEQAMPPAAGEAGVVDSRCGAGNLCSANNLRTTTEFSQEFPLTDRVKRVTVERLSAAAATEAPLTETTYAWHSCYRQSGGACIAGKASAGSPNPSWVVYPSITVEKRYELGQRLAAPIVAATPLAIKTTISEVDTESGEAAKACQIVEDATGVTLSGETRVLFNDKSAWWLGRVDERSSFTGFTAPYIWNGALPATCPTTGSPEKLQRNKYTYYPSGIAYRKLETEELLVRDPIQPKTAAANVSERKITYEYSPSAPANLLNIRVTARDVLDTALRPATLTTSYAYSGDQYFVATATNPVGHRSTQTTDPATGGILYRQEVQNGPTATTAYDALGRVLSTQVSGEQMVYHRILFPAGCSGFAVLKRQVIQAGAPTKSECVDLLGRTVATVVDGFDGAPITSLVEYNDRGARTREYVPWNAEGRAPYYTEYSGIDALGRVGKKVVVRGGGELFAAGKGDARWETTYAYAGFKTSISSARASAEGGALNMSRTTDSRGKLVQTTQQVTDTAKGTHDIVTKYGYDSAGNVTDIIDAAGNRISATYDDLGRKLTATDPDRGKWSYAWDGLGRLKSQTDARNAWTYYSYDAIGRPVSRHAQGAADASKVAEASWVYDQNSQYGTLSNVTGAVVNGDAYSESYKYDALCGPSR